MPLSIEPTQVGKVVITGTVIVLAAVYVYEFAKWSKNRQDDREELYQSYLVPCLSYYSYDYDCRSRYDYCISKGQWFHSLCPYINRVSQ